jgi:YjbE family integral membrane protein
MDFLTSPAFWTALLQIIIIDILLGGDNAVIIALACRKLPPKHSAPRASSGARWAPSSLRVILIAFAMTLLNVPFLKLVGAMLLVWIGIKLIAPDEEGHGDMARCSDKLVSAIKTIIVADLVMSVDNVIAIAGAAQNAGEHSMLLVVLGLLVSIPIIVWGSTLVIKLMARFPIVIVAGGMLLGWIAGGMLVTDPAFANTTQWTWMPKIEQTSAIKYGAAVIGALLVLAIGKYLAARNPPPAEAA